jgi:luciferase family oxidoreductase group 1
MFRSNLQAMVEGQETLQSFTQLNRIMISTLMAWNLPLQPHKDLEHEDPVISALDLVAVRQGKTAKEAIARSVELAQHLEKLGHHRFWVPEHHNVALFASCAPAVLIGCIAGATESICVGAGGVMLLNHAPLVIAEQFGTLKCIYPGRIDLGLGRAAGSSSAQDEMMKKVLRRDPQATGENFREWLVELQRYLGPDLENQEVKSGPGQGTNVPVYLLSSSGYSAQLAGELGLPFAFAAHIRLAEPRVIGKSLPPTFSPLRNTEPALCDDCDLCVRSRDR